MSDVPQPDWEAFYRDYRKPGYVPGYEIGARLGGGTFGLVFKARKQSIGKDYAIKFLKVDDGEVRRAVLQELEQVKYFAQVDHPNLVAIEDRGEVDGIPYLVMAYAGAETLREAMGKSSPPELLNYFLQACRGVAALHQRALVHFDLKPANVFLKGGVARVGDYGLSKLVTHSGGSLSMGRGTPYYMAPEMLQRRGDHRSDIYSLGVMLYEILVGELPFRGDSEWQVLKQHEQQQPTFPPQLAPLHAAALARALAKSPDERFQSVDDFAQALAASTPISEPAPTPPPPPQRSRRAPPSRRPQRQHAGSVIALLVMIAAFSFFVITKNQSVSARSRRATTHAQMQTLNDQRAILRANTATLAGRLREFGRDACIRLRDAEAGRRLPELRPLEMQSLPPDLALYKDELQPIALAPGYIEASAVRLEIQGLPAVLAAIAMLQEFDYDDAECCRQAWQLHQFLAQATGFRDINVPRPGDEVDPMTVRHFQAAADAWRRFAERFCACADDFQELLVATGKQLRGG